MKIWIPKFLLKNAIVEEKILTNKSLDELLVLKDEEHDFLSINIPILVAIWIAILPIKDLWNWRTLLIYYLIWIIISFYIIEVNEVTKKNMKIYNKVISNKMKEQRDMEEDYKKEISGYLKGISENIKGKKCNL